MIEEIRPHAAPAGKPLPVDTAAATHPFGAALGTAMDRIGEQRSRPEQALPHQRRLPPPHPIGRALRPADPVTAGQHRPALGGAEKTSKSPQSPIDVSAIQQPLPDQPGDATSQPDESQGLLRAKMLRPESDSSEIPAVPATGYALPLAAALHNYQVASQAGPESRQPATAASTGKTIDRPALPGAAITASAIDRHPAQALPASAELAASTPPADPPAPGIDRPDSLTGAGLPATDTEREKTAGQSLRSGPGASSAGDHASDVRPPEGNLPGAAPTVRQTDPTMAKAAATQAPRRTIAEADEPTVRTDAPAPRIDRPVSAAIDHPAAHADNARRPIQSAGEPSLLGLRDPDWRPPGENPPFIAPINGETLRTAGGAAAIQPGPDSSPPRPVGLADSISPINAAGVPAGAVSASFTFAADRASTAPSAAKPVEAPTPGPAVTGVMLVPEALTPTTEAARPPAAPDASMFSLPPGWQAAHADPAIPTEVPARAGINPDNVDPAARFLAAIQDMRRASGEASPSVPGRRDSSAIGSMASAWEGQQTLAPSRDNNPAPTDPGFAAMMGISLAPTAGVTTPSIVPLQLDNPWPVRDPAFPAQLAAQVGETLLAGAHKAEITLSPPELGPIKIELALSGEQASIAFSAARPETRDAIEQSLPILSAMLAEHGLDLSQTSVGGGSPDAGGGQSAREAIPRPRTAAPLPGSDSGTPPAANRVERRPRGLLDLFA